MTDPGPLSVEADLDLDLDGTPARVTASGRRLLVDLPSVPAALRALSGLPDRRGDAERVLRVTDLTVEVRVRESPVALLGAEASPGPLSRALGLAPLEFRAGGAAVAAGRELLVRGRSLAGGQG